jgi:hypothetical protein
MLLQKRVVRHATYPWLLYEPMLARDQERIAILDYIYTYNDV